MSSEHRHTVLVVDDDRFNRNAVAEILQNDCRVLMARNGPSALELLQQHDVSLVLLDVSMPGMDGYEVLERMRADPRTADLAVIFLTGMTDTADEERGLLMGAADYVQKPIREAIVRARVQVHLKLVQQRRELELLSTRDPLTGIANRRLFDEALQAALRRMKRAGQPLGVAILDVDHFKQFNDHYGHGAGDEALKAIAGILDGFARRPGDVAARYGGEEFVLLLPEVIDFAPILERLRAGVVAAAIPHQKSPTAPHLTVSGGGVVWHPLAVTTGAALLSRADQLLYRAKQEGRNRFHIETLGSCPWADRCTARADMKPFVLPGEAAGGLAGPR